MKTRRTPALERKLFDGIATGITLREMCRRLKLARATVYGWLKDEAFAARMAHARALGFDAIADEMLEIADDSRNDWVTRADADAGGPLVRNPENVARAKLRIDTRMRVLSRWDPKRYADSLALGSPGGVAGLAATDGTALLPNGAPAPAEPLAIAVRLAAIFTTLAAREEQERAQDGDDPDAL